ncbi:MAG: tRNA (adenosine(37)-N6)-threonylcarbamoyltransferase complex ATPase subunit type 1 TsaE [Pseudomonadota bacterium]
MTRLGPIAATHDGSIPPSDGTLPDEAATAAVAAALAPRLGAGDTVALWGELGAGKTAFARALIRARLGDAAAEVASPSYTLVNVFPTEPPLWHADLYRLGGADEAAELGLDEAFGQAILLLEWPGRLGPLLPARRLDVTLDFIAAGGEGERTLAVHPRGAWPALDGWPGLDRFAGPA